MLRSLSRGRHRKRRFSTLLLPILLLALALMLGSASAQDEPLVVFIIGRNLGTSTYADSSPTGLSNLAFIIDSLGVTPRTIEVGQPIPDSTRLVVISRPTRTFPFLLEARLWDYMQNGGHVLLTLDPENYYVGGLGNLVPRFNQTGLRTLFQLDYGLDMANAFLAEPWMSNRSIVNLSRTYSYALPSDVLNPITAPLLTYEVPVRLWGARHIDVDPLGINSYAMPLFYSVSGYGETDTGVFPRVRSGRVELGASPLEMNINDDVLGRIEAGAIAVNTRTGSRLAVLGDSEIIQNGYGLSGTAISPTYPGNRILVDRLIAWLLEIPVRDWPALPPNYTWLAVDGQANDWAGRQRVTSLTNVSVDEDTLLFRNVRAFQDDVYAYFLFEPNTSLTADTQISLQHDSATIIAQAGQVSLADGELIEEARFAVGSVAELRLPLRYLRPSFNIDALCLTTEEVTGCVDVTLAPRQATTFAPFDHTLMGYMTGVVISNDGVSVRMRVSPSIESNVASNVPIGTPLAVLGRDPTTTWVYAESAAHAGWIASLLLEVNGDLNQLPAIEGS